MADTLENTEKPAFELTFPEEENAFVKERYREAGTILEYGSGGSTVLAAEYGKPCVSVESDQQWAEMLTERLNDRFHGRPSARVFPVFMGPTKEWGYPKNARNWGQFWRYPLSVWEESTRDQPDLVLIDGRMRTACFAAVMMNIKQETTVLFDDYTNRNFYHVIERYVKPDLFAGRMAQFTVRPGMLTPDAFSDVVPWFFSLR
ncbi:hypothetical protein AN191_00030 [Loktanella sp. 5RATIMAR09]|uniref:hypothetical protein n=1 Tax=Loktanella sp. 5RATIMAR09 TaxID=1225655 RepID=UPI0006EB9D56|nr:hypothetical protein [Loktanella sp. 5RATIMAR09]KQI73337.1 hypothetical protein AN191_00030 [Loktanella sp. 5RATIMAR09]